MNKENNNSGSPCYTIIICSRDQVQIGDDLAMDEANSILMRANDQVTIMI